MGAENGSGSLKWLGTPFSGTLLYQKLNFEVRTHNAHRSENTHESGLGPGSTVLDGMAMIIGTRVKYAST